MSRKRGHGKKLNWGGGHAWTGTLRAADIACGYLRWTEVGRQTRTHGWEERCEGWRTRWVLRERAGGQVTVQLFGCRPSVLIAEGLPPQWKSQSTNALFRADAIWLYCLLTVCPVCATHHWIQAAALLREGGGQKSGQMCAHKKNKRPRLVTMWQKQLCLLMRQQVNNEMTGRRKRGQRDVHKNTPWFH